MTLTIDANAVWKPRNIFRAIAPKSGDLQDLQKMKTVMMRVLAHFPEACQAVVRALGEIGGEPWRPFPDVGT